MTNLKNLIRLKNLNYADLVSKLNHVCRGSYNLPNVNDELTTVNNEVSFKVWKEKILLKYPTAKIEIDPLKHWFERVKIIDTAFTYDKSIIVNAKANYLSQLS